tara:strand:- start:1850 stop:2170 length:321 start_codon:yes stop_codon:yes gene_type:complete
MVGKTPLCSQNGGSLAGQTFKPTPLAVNKPSNIILFCPAAWDTTRVKTSLVPYQGTYFKPGDKASPDDYRSLPGTFIHEMLHLLYPFQCELASDFSSQYTVSNEGS